MATIEFNSNPKNMTSHNRDEMKDMRKNENKSQISRISSKNNIILPVNEKSKKLFLSSDKPLKPFARGPQDLTEDSQIMDQKVTYLEKGPESGNKKNIQLLNQDNAKTYHYKMNIMNLISSFLGILGLILQMIEVLVFNIVQGILLQCSPTKLLLR